MPCPTKGVDCAEQTRVEVLEGWYRPINGTATAALDATTFTLALTIESSLDDLDADDFEAKLRSYLQCEDDVSGRVEM